MTKPDGGIAPPVNHPLFLTSPTFLSPLSEGDQTGSLALVEAFPGLAGLRRYPPSL